MKTLDELLDDIKALSPRQAVAEVERFFDALPPDQAERLAAERPDDVGELNGAPWHLRVRTNGVRLLRDREKLRAKYGLNGIDRADDLLERVRQLSPEDRDRLNTMNEMLRPRLQVVANGTRREVLEVPRQFLSLGTEGDGRLAEVFGDLSTAENITFSVHGMGVTLDDLATQTDIAKAIHTESGPKTATVNFIYDGPNGLGPAMSKKAAFEASSQLADCIAGVRSQNENARTTLFAHSYGTIVAAEAIRDNRSSVDSVIFAGSPGLGHDINAMSDLNADPNTKFFAMRAQYDAVSYGEWHGRDPADFEDVVRLATERPDGPSVTWHEQYWRPASEALRNVGRVCRGAYDKLTTTDSTVAAETKLALGVSWGGVARGVSGTAGRAFGKVFDGAARRSASRRTGAERAEERR